MVSLGAGSLASRRHFSGRVSAVFAFYHRCVPVPFCVASVAREGDLLIVVLLLFMCVLSAGVLANRLQSVRTAVHCLFLFIVIVLLFVVCCAVWAISPERFGAQLK